MSFIEYTLLVLKIFSFVVLQMFYLKVQNLEDRSTNIMFLSEFSSNEVVIIQDSSVQINNYQSNRKNDEEAS